MKGRAHSRDESELAANKNKQLIRSSELEGLYRENWIRLDPGKHHEEEG